MLRAIARTYREAFSGLPRPVWLLAAATLVNRSGTMVLPFLALFLTQERGFTTPEAGRVLALYGLGAVAGSWLGGWLCDRSDPKRVMGWTLSLTGVGFLLVGRVESRIWIAILIVVLSLVGEAFRPASAAALAAASGPANRTKSFALHRLAINVGMTLGPALGGFLALYDYFWLFVVDGATCLAAAVLLRLFFPAVQAEPETAPAAATSAGSPWRDGPFLAMMVLVFLMASVTFQEFSTFPLSLRRDFGFAENRIGLAFSVNTLMVVLFEMVLVHSLAARDPLKVVGVGSLLFCLGFGLLPLGSGFAHVAFAVMVLSVGEMMSMPILSGVVANRAEEGSRGRYMGLFMLAFSAAFVSAPLIGTWLYEGWGYKALWFGCGALGLPLCLGFQVLALFMKKDRSRAVEPSPPSPLPPLQSPSPGEGG
ncbi:MAG TPA: MFS transporter [Thermoanaerobaculia bacterium]|nr:MFS transporter [Thermoanaerobaculia bacterium]